jgi:hypothetical protein
MDTGKLIAWALRNEVFLIVWALEHGSSVRSKRGNIFWKKGDKVVWAPEEKLTEKEHLFPGKVGTLAVTLDGQLDDRETANLLDRFVMAYKDDLDTMEYILHRGGKVFINGGYWLQVYEGDNWLYLHDGRSTSALDRSKSFRNNLIEYLPSISEDELERLRKEYDKAHQPEEAGPFEEKKSILSRPKAAIILETLLGGGRFKDSLGYEWALSEDFDMCVVARELDGAEHLLKVPVDVKEFITMCNTLSEARVFLASANKVLNDIRRDNGDR